MKAIVFGIFAIFAVQGGFAHILPASTATLVRTPSYETAVVHSQRLNGGFSYSTFENHAYAPVVHSVGCTWFDFKFKLICALLPGARISLRLPTIPSSLLPSSTSNLLGSTRLHSIIWRISWRSTRRQSSEPCWSWKSSRQSANRRRWRYCFCWISLKNCWLWDKKYISCYVNFLKNRIQAF